MLDFHKDQFTQALYDSSNDRALTVEYLTQALEDASNTSTNWERKNINFDSVKDLGHDEALKVTELTQQNGWESTYGRSTRSRPPTRSQPNSSSTSWTRC